MSVIRQLAIWISAMVVRWASPGSKEWAEALAAEVWFVEGDWSALGWALSSLRVLLRYRRAPLMSLEDFMVAMRKYLEGRRTESWTWIIFLMQAFLQMENWRRAAAPLERVGSGMTTIAEATLVVLLLLRLWKRSKLPHNNDALEMLRFYQAELQRVSDLPRKPSTWVAALSLCCLLVGLVLSQGGRIGSHPIWNCLMALLFLVLVLFCVHTRRTSLRRLARLKVLLAEQR